MFEGRVLYEVRPQIPRPDPLNTETAQKIFTAYLEEFLNQADISWEIGPPGWRDQFGGAYTSLDALGERVEGTTVFGAPIDRFEDLLATFFASLQRFLGDRRFVVFRNKPTVVLDCDTMPPQWRIRARLSAYTAPIQFVNFKESVCRT